MKPLTLDDKAKLESILRNSGDFLSEYCFSNLYLFRRKHRYAVEESGGCLFIRGVSYDGLSYVMPCCQKQLASPEYREALTAQLSQVDMIFPVSAKALAYFGEESFRFESMAEDLDYIYAREKMQFFPGRRLQNKRNLLYQFLKYYPDHRTVDLSETEAKDGAVAVLERWQSSFDSEESTDYEPCREALELYDELGWDSPDLRFLTAKNLPDFLSVSRFKTMSLPFTLLKAINRSKVFISFCSARRLPACPKVFRMLIWSRIWGVCLCGRQNPRICRI